jgi:hypothetical protein
MMGSAGAASPAYIEDVFSTWLYTGNSSTQTITNGIDLSGKGGLVWCKARSAAYRHELVDTARGGGNKLESQSTAAQATGGSDITGFTSSGFTLGNVSGEVNFSGATNASWTFRKAAKFFDVVTYTGNGTDQRAISHNLGSTPGFFIVKRTDSTGNWNCYHRSRGKDKSLRLNLTDAEVANTDPTWNGMWGGEPTSTTFTVNNSTNSCNTNGATYVAYLFAHDAGGFGDSGNDSVVKCGSFTTDGSGNATVNLGWEPQWLLVKQSAAASDWLLIDVMRGASQTGVYPLSANSAAAENPSTGGPYWVPTSTGFSTTSYWASATAIYIAIRRGPMKTPTDATKVFSAVLTTSQPMSIGFPTDLHIDCQPGVDSSKYWVPRLTNGYMSSTSTGSESAGATYFKFDLQNSFSTGSFWGSAQTINWQFRRAPGYFDVVAYTGTGVARTVSHNLGVAPELMIVKSRSNASSWIVYSATLGNNNWLALNSVDAQLGATAMWNTTTPTASVFSTGGAVATNLSGYTYIAYLFATCPGVSKVGNYTGTGTTKQIDCGFTAGARFVLIKRTDSTGDWYVWDSARGIVAGNDPYLLLNSTAAEVTSTDYVDTYSAGFEISSTAPAAINANGGSYIYLSVA